ncbi:hypothetical protein [Limnobacter sp.]|uniref:hypothetical protein n=1 Tax=Limnobacter sp. TaxID=2003368 RepID=UPI0025910648|nr:hypothetical protein [Limnobacter sp.]
MAHTALTIHSDPHQLASLQAARRPGMATYAKLAAQAGVCALAAGGLAYSLLQSAQGERHYTGGQRHLLNEADHGCASNEYYHHVSDTFMEAFKWTGIVSASLLGSAALAFGAGSLAKRGGLENAGDRMIFTSAIASGIGGLGGAATLMMAFNLINKNKCVTKTPFGNF